MAELKTKLTDADVETFLQSIPDERKRQDSYAVLEMMQAATGDAPRLWGSNIVGFGSYRYTYASGRKGDWFITGFSPRKQNLTFYLAGIYMTSGFEQHADLLARLGKHKLGKGCLYINHLKDVDQDVLRELIMIAVQKSGEGTEPPAEE